MLLSSLDALAKEERCARCTRPMRICICDKLPEAKRASPIEVVILQHPQESDVVLGTAPLVTSLLARTETLVSFAQAYVGEDGGRRQTWQAMENILSRANLLQRKSVRYALESPEVGANLLEITQWLEGLVQRAQTRGTNGDDRPVLSGTLRQWSRRRIRRLHGQWKAAQKLGGTLDADHRIRILSKRIRYAIEAMQTLLPRRRAQCWLRQASQAQLCLGVNRDVMKAWELLEALEADRGLIEFMRGVAVGQGRL